VTGTTLRLDKFLWHARLCKTRPAQPVRVGDLLVVSHGGWRRQIEILGLGERRGPASEAQLLYRETAAPTRLTPVDPGWTALLAEDDD